MYCGIKYINKDRCKRWNAYWRTIEVENCF